MKNWNIKPIEIEGLGWIIKENEENVAMVLLEHDIDKSKNNAALIGTAPELLDLCNELLTHIDENSEVYEKAQVIIQKAQGLCGLEEELSYFDDFIFKMEQNIKVIEVDLDENKFSYKGEATMDETFGIVPVDDEIGILMIDISIKSTSDDIEEYYWMKYPIPDLISKNTYHKFIQCLSKKYSNLSELITDYEKQPEDVTFQEFLEDIFYGEFSEQFKRSLSLEDYLKEYHLVFDTEELYMEAELPTFLQGCSHIMHLDVEVTIKGETINGMIFYKESDDKYYIYNKEDKAVSLFMIQNTLEERSSTQIKFNDYLQS